MSANKGSTSMRNIPDVALTADNIFVVYNNGSQGMFGGTSCAAPWWAAFTALVNQHAAAHGRPAAGFINPAVYAIGKGAGYAADFHDITTGNNTNRTSHTNFFAVPGYDLCTGWGTPNGSNLISALVSASSLITPTVVWTNSRPLVYGTALGAAQLNATASVPGTFAYTPAAGTALNAGSQTLSVAFTPTDTIDFGVVTAQVTQVVEPAARNVTAASTNRPFGQPNPTFQGVITGLQTGDIMTASYSCAATTASPVGAYPIVPSLIDSARQVPSASTTRGESSATPKPGASSRAGTA
jgi:subtilase family serine protease